MKLIRADDLKNQKIWPMCEELTPEQLKEAYALARADFTEEDLQAFAEDIKRIIESGTGTPMEEFLDELEQEQKAHDRKPSK